MCDQTEVAYLPGEVVWVKLRALWWPGLVQDYESLPEEITSSLRKRPIATIKFFQEDSYEYVHKLDLIYHYNCSRKQEFIKKGLDLCRKKTADRPVTMDFFPSDIVTAEELTNGDPNILQDEAFKPEEKTKYTSLFGSEKKKFGKKKGKEDSPLKDKAARRKKLASKLEAMGWLSRGITANIIYPSPDTPRIVTHRRFLNKARNPDAKSDYESRLMVQKCEDEPSSISDKKYHCVMCGYVTCRLNVIVLHFNTTHSRKMKNIFDAPSILKGGSLRNPLLKLKSESRKSDSGRVGFFSRKRKSVKVKSEKPKPVESEVESSETESVKAPPVKKEKGKPGRKRKVKLEEKGQDRDQENIKKPKVLDSLLADWDEDVEQEEDEDSKPRSDDEDSGEGNESASVEDDTASAGKSSVAEDTSASKSKEVFEFDPDEDDDISFDLAPKVKGFGRRIPRVIDSSKDKKKEGVESKKPSKAKVSKKEKVKEEEKCKEEKKSKEEEKCKEEEKDKEDLDEFESLLAETAVPSLPSVPKPSTFSQDAEEDLHSESILTEPIKDEVSDSKSLSVEPPKPPKQPRSHEAKSSAKVTVEKIPDLTAVATRLNDDSGFDPSRNEGKSGSDHTYVGSSGRKRRRSLLPLEKSDGSLDIMSMQVVLDDTFEDSPRVRREPSLPHVEGARRRGRPPKRGRGGRGGSASLKSPPPPQPKSVHVKSAPPRGSESPSPHLSSKSPPPHQSPKSPPRSSSMSPSSYAGPKSPGYPGPKSPGYQGPKSPGYQSPKSPGTSQGPKSPLPSQGTKSPLPSPGPKSPVSSQGPKSPSPVKSPKSPPAEQSQKSPIHHQSSKSPSPYQSPKRQATPSSKSPIHSPPGSPGPKSPPPPQSPKSPQPQQSPNQLGPKSPQGFQSPKSPLASPSLLSSGRIGTDMKTIKSPPQSPVRAGGEALLGTALPGSKSPVKSPQASPTSQTVLLSPSSTKSLGSKILTTGSPALMKTSAALKKISTPGAVMVQSKPDLQPEACGIAKTLSLPSSSAGGNLPVKTIKVAVSGSSGSLTPGTPGTPGTPRKVMIVQGKGGQKMLLPKEAFSNIGSGKKIMVITKGSPGKLVLTSQQQKILASGGKITTSSGQVVTSKGTILSSMAKFVTTKASTSTATSSAAGVELSTEPPALVKTEGKKTYKIITSPQSKGNILLNTSGGQILVPVSSIGASGSGVTTSTGSKQYILPVGAKNMKLLNAVGSSGQKVILQMKSSPAKAGVTSSPKTVQPIVPKMQSISPKTVQTMSPKAIPSLTPKTIQSISTKTVQPITPKIGQTITPKTSQPVKVTKIATMIQPVPQLTPIGAPKVARPKQIKTVAAKPVKSQPQPKSPRKNSALLKSPEAAASSSAIPLGTPLKKNIGIVPNPNLKTIVPQAKPGKKISLASKPAPTETTIVTQMPGTVQVVTSAVPGLDQMQTILPSGDASSTVALPTSTQQVITGLAEDGSQVMYLIDNSQLIGSLDGSNQANFGNIVLTFDNMGQPVVSSAASDFAFSTPSSGQDILAEALANTQVLQSDASGDLGLDTSGLLSSHTSNAMYPPTLSHGVLETSLTLNQPIMTPLEDLSAVTTLQPPPASGVTTALDLPSTITMPDITISTSSYSSLPIPSATIQSTVFSEAQNVTTFSTLAPSVGSVFIDTPVPDAESFLTADSVYEQTGEGASMPLLDG